jgi:cell division protein FtsW (lipid II flippase)
LFQNSTDYIFTVGEEWGFAGSLVVMALFAGLLLRIIYLAERQKQNSVGFMVTVLQEFYLPLLCKYCMVSGIFPYWSSTSVFLLRRIWTLGLFFYLSKWMQIK